MPLRRRRLPRHRLPAARPLGVQRQQLQLFHLRAQRLPVHLRPKQGRGVREGGGCHDGGFGLSSFSFTLSPFPLVRFLPPLSSASFPLSPPLSTAPERGWGMAGEEIGDEL